ncbi:MAG: J domain-containing protein [Thermomicrobiales bacterium]
MAEISGASPNYYEVLGVAYDAGKADVTRAYRERMKAIHPDRKEPEQRAAAEERAKALNAAYATLSSPTRRAEYDRTIRADLVRDQVMNRYVGGFYPAAGGSGDPFGQQLKREQTEGERREVAAADRSAVVSLLAAFAGLFLVVVVLLLLWAGAETLWRAIR